MRRSVIVVYAASLLINTILLPSVSDAESFLDPIFKKLNYNVTPRTLVEYRKAFNDLAHYHIILNLNYQSLQNENTLLQKELEAERVEKNKVNSVLTIRENIESVEGRIDTEINYRSKPDMMSILRNPEKVFYVNLTTEDQETIKRLCIPSYENVHHVKWLYYLLTCNSLLARRIRSLLLKNNISVFAFCQTVGQIYEKISVRIHNVATNLTPESLKEGLKLYGLTDKIFLDCAEVLPSINQLVGLFEGEFTPFMETTLSSEKST